MTEQKKQNGPPLVSVAAIVGGMSAQKQRRILSRGVDVLVATPGRLWDIIQEVRCLVVIPLHVTCDVSGRTMNSLSKSRSSGSSCSTKQIA